MNYLLTLFCFIFSLQAFAISTSSGPGPVQCLFSSTTGTCINDGINGCHVEQGTTCTLSAAGSCKKVTCSGACPPSGYYVPHNDITAWNAFVINKPATMSIGLCPTTTTSSTSSSSSSGGTNAICGGTVYTCLVGTVANIRPGNIGCIGPGASSNDWDCLSPDTGNDVSCTQPFCFIADTKVIMADGSKRNIQDVNIGEWVRGGNGEISEVKGVHMPILGNRRDRKLYSFNGGKFFVTAEHPFKTRTGWKAMDPAWSMEEHSMNNVSKLNIGDILITSTGQVLLETIEVKDGTSDTQLYNLMLGGDHTYFADDYLVHNIKCLQ